MAQSSEPLWYVVWITIIGVGAMLIGLIASRVLKRRLRREEPAQAFTLQDLRELRDRGAITTQEYETMRATIIAQMTADAAAPSASDGESQPERAPDAEEGTSGASDPAPGDPH